MKLGDIYKIYFDGEGEDGKIVLNNLVEDDDPEECEFT